MSLATLADIGIKAIRLQEATDRRKVVGEEFSKACHRWNQDNGGGYIERHSERWDRMLEGVDREYQAILRAKADESNARARLSRACKKAQKELAAGRSAQEILRRASEATT